MKTQKVEGYLIGIAGLVMLVWNAYICISRKESNKIAAGIALLFCLIDAALTRKEK